MFQEEYDKLTRGEKSQFSETVNELLYHQFILRTVYDRKSQMFKVDPSYSFIERNFSMIEDFLSYLDIAITKVNDEGVVFISSSADMNHMRFDTTTTLVVYALRSYYEEQISKAPQNTNVLMSSSNLRVLLQDTGLSNVTQRLSSSSISLALRTLDSFNIITRHTNTYSDPTYKFYIRPTIRYVISNEKMNALYNFLTKNGEEDDGLYSPFNAATVSEDVRSQEDDSATPIVPKMGVDIPVRDDEEDN